jgi:phosphoserine phosphatase
MHYRAADAAYEWYEPSTFPLGYMDQAHLQAPRSVDLAPGDILGLISDGIYEYENESGHQFGQAGIVSVVDRHHDDSMDELVRRIMGATYDHGGTVPQADDITIVLMRREQ